METLDKPVWLLDVDGVIFPFGSKPGWGRGPRTIHIPINDGRILRERFAPQLVDEIRHLIEEDVVDVVWAASWVEEADKLERIFGWPPLRRAFPVCPPESFNEKVVAARRVINSGRRLIWTDDLVIPQWGPVYDQLTGSGRALLIRPAANKGLQPEDMHAIYSFLGIGVVT